MSFFAHTATCGSCGVLLCYPYPQDDGEIIKSWASGADAKDVDKIRASVLKWHLDSGSCNHHNFTNMALFALNDDHRYGEMKILDYGGGAGQFALVCKSIFPLSEIYIMDVSDAALLDQFRPLNNQILYHDFLEDDTRFSFIFMNDVFEHVRDPLGLLRVLRGKLADTNSRVFIDTPCQFWIYPVTKLVSKKLHEKVLRGTVDHDHQQIWTKQSFAHVANKAGFVIEKYLETSEFTQSPDFYLDNMRITNPLIRLVARLFYRLAPLLSKNKIMAVIKPN